MPGGRERLTDIKTQTLRLAPLGSYFDFEVRMQYGVPYQGSKNKIAKWVVDHLPAGHTLVDLFAGGCAVTHAAMLAGRWDKYIVNDIGDAPDVFLKAVHGAYADETHWISREDFYRLKDADPYVSLCWSFGNNRRDYLYARWLEPWKRALHYARVLGDCSQMLEFGIVSDGSAADIRVHHEEYKQKYIRWWLSRQKYPPAELDVIGDKMCGCRLQRLESLERLQSLQRLECLQSLQRLARLQSDYAEVDVPAGAVVYADPPYRGTNQKGYAVEFDARRFDDWLASVPYMVIVSEYTAPRGCIEVARIEKHRLLGTGNGSSDDCERLFVQERYAAQYYEMLNVGDQLSFA